MGVISVIIALLGIYLGAGIAFAIAFVMVGVAQVDPAARAAPIGFRLIILPAVTALWPFLLVKWCAARSPGGAA
jgi:hypothetical protein